MCEGCAPATGINSPPEGGVHGPPARFACAVPAAPRALPGRGLHPRPPGLRPWRAFAHRAPAASATQPEGFRARVRRWRGWATACVCPCPTPSPSPSPLDSVFQKQGNRSVGKPQALSTGERQSLQRRRWADPGTARRALSTLGGQRGCPRPKRPQGRAPAPPGTRFPPAAGISALCRFIRENDSCEFGKNPALARARARLLVFFS